jgi:recombinational DNA repair protein (RecF pathway)
MVQRSYSEPRMPPILYVPGGIRATGWGMRLDRCSFCGRYEVVTGALVRGRDSAICANCLQAAAGVTDTTALYLAKSQIQLRLGVRARWHANGRWKARRLPAFD